MKPGFRKVVFSVIIMAIVLFYQRGIMGENEFNLAGLMRFFKSIGKKKNPSVSAKSGE